MVWQLPCGIFASKSVFGDATSFSIAFRSSRTLRRLLFQADALGGASVGGQYPFGHGGEMCLGFRLNSRMSHCPMRMCSSNCHKVCSAPFGFLPRSLARNHLLAVSSMT